MNFWFLALEWLPCLRQIELNPNSKSKSRLQITIALSFELIWKQNDLFFTELGFF